MVWSNSRPWLSLSLPIFLTFTIPLLQLCSSASLDSDSSINLDTSEIDNLDLSEKDLEILYGFVKFTKEMASPSDQKNTTTNTDKNTTRLSYPVLRPECVYNHTEVEQRLGTIDLITREGYAAETHYITTADGYIFEIHRMPAPGKHPVLVLPGVFQTSRDLVLNCYRRGIGFRLFDSGYDVWLGNYRGNSYGRNHTTLSVDSFEFWSFSNDEFGEYDFPASIDYILEHTGQKKLSWIGFSLSSTSIFGTLAERPEYNEKLHILFGLAPAVFLGNTKSFILRFLASNRDGYTFLFNKIFRGRVFPELIQNFFYAVFPRICLKEALANRPGFCTSILYYLDSNDFKQNNYPKFPFMLTLIPSSTSVHVMSHWLQEVIQPRFAKFDFGKQENLIRYGSILPPAYNLSNVVAPVVLVYGPSDIICDKADVFRLAESLPRPPPVIRVSWKYFNHIDYLLAKDADLLLYDPIIKMLNDSFT